MISRAELGKFPIQIKVNAQMVSTSSGLHREQVMMHSNAPWAITRNGFRPLQKYLKAQGMLMFEMILLL